MGNIELGESSAFGSELVEAGSSRYWTAVAGEIAEAEIVSVEKDDVGARWCFGRLGREGGGQQERQREQA